MNKTCCHTILGTILCAISGLANAMPIQVNYSDIDALLIEDFESVATGTHGSSQSFNGFSASVNSGNLFVIDSSTFCGTNLDQCLVNQKTASDSRTFDTFGSGTNFFGFELTPIANSESSMTTNFDEFEVTVTGVSGTSVFNISDNGLFGFGDTSGLISITLVNLGDIGGATGLHNYGIDDVITGARLFSDGVATEVSEPAIAFLLGTGLMGLVMRRRYRA